MKLNLENPVKQLAYLRYVKEWRPEEDNKAKNPGEAAVFKAGKIRELLANDKLQCDALKKLMDSDVKVNPRVKNLPSIDRLYKLLCQDNTEKADRYGRMLRKFREVNNIWNEVNIIDGHMYAATTEEPWKLKHYEPGIESDSWLVIDEKRGGECLAKLNKNNKDYGEYLVKRFMKHPKLGDNGLDIQPNQPYRMLTYVGKTKHGSRPLFVVVYIVHSSGDFKKDLSKLPQEWVPLYVNVMSMPNRKPPVEAK
jgi:hypothetical protein